MYTHIYTYICILYLRKRVYKDINLFAREAFFGLVAAAVPRFRVSSYGRWHLRVWECRTWSQSCRTCGNQALWLVVTPPGRVWWSALPLVDRPSTRHPGSPDLTPGENATFYTFPIILRKCGSCVTVAAFLASVMRRALIVYPPINPAEKRPADIAVSTARHELFPSSCAPRDAVPVMRAALFNHGRLLSTT